MQLLSRNSEPQHVHTSFAEIHKQHPSLAESKIMTRAPHTLGKTNRPTVGESCLEGGFVKLNEKAYVDMGFRSPVRCRVKDWKRHLSQSRAQASSTRARKHAAHTSHACAQDFASHIYAQETLHDIHKAQYCT